MSSAEEWINVPFLGEGGQKGTSAPGHLEEGGEEGQGGGGGGGEREEEDNQEEGEGKREQYCEVRQSFDCH